MLTLMMPSISYCLSQAAGGWCEELERCGVLVKVEAFIPQHHADSPGVGGH